MKSLIYLIQVSILLMVIIATSGCKSKKKEDPTPQTTDQEKVITLLTGGTGTWAPPAANGITLEGIDVTAEFFKDFTIRFTAAELFTTGTTPVWLRQDTWHFKTGSSTIILRGQDDKEITIESISETELKLTLEWTSTTFEGGRNNSLPGRYQFVLNK